MYTEDQKEKFFTMVDSLKKCRRADLSDISEDSSIIEKLYIDPLHSELVLKGCLKPNTTLLIGRKGTGKSTILARLQHEIRKSSDKLSLYIDVKTVFDQSHSISYEGNKYQGIMKEEELRQYLLRKTFLREILKQIKEEVKTNTWKFYLSKLTPLFGPDKQKFFAEVDSIFTRLDDKDYEDISVLKGIGVKQTESQDLTQVQSIKAGLSCTAASITAEVKEEQKDAESLEKNFSEILLRYFNPMEIIGKIRDLLQKIGIKYVFICLDDFSEIDSDAMGVFVDTVIAPLNNWSNEYFKFKIAAYPGRYYLGNIDPTKIDQVKLDYFDLYLAGRSTDTEKVAAEYVKRLLNRRSKYFCGVDFNYFIDTKQSESEFYATLVQIASNVPRNIGWILWYANQYSISKNRGIGIKDLELSAQRYYQDSIEVYFSHNTYMKERFSEKLSKFHLRSLLNLIISSARKNKSAISISTAKIYDKDKKNPPSSHFYIQKDYEEILMTLELNFFITKYSEQKDQDSVKIMSFYTLNYGLCMKEDIIYGRGSNRKYIIQRRFNYNSIIEDFLKNAKRLTCNKCGTTYPMEDLDKLKYFGMLCPACRKGQCSETDVVVEIPLADEAIQLPELELHILNSLRIDSPQYATQLAEELDCTYHKISRKIDNLELRSFVKRKREIGPAGSRTYYYITDKAMETYFVQ